MIIHTQKIPKRAVKPASRAPISAPSADEQPVPLTISPLGIPFTPAAILNLQRTVGNRAVQRMVAAHPAHVGLRTKPIVQRYQLVKVGGAAPNPVLDPSTFDQRSSANDWNVNTTNRGWIKIFFPNAVGKTWDDKKALVGGAASVQVESTDATGTMVKIHTVSKFGVEHAEEACLKIVEAMGINSRNPVGTVGEIYIHSLYTERAPCTLQDNTMNKDKTRLDREGGSCHALLNHRLDNGTTVYYSVPNSNPAHNKLMMQSNFIDYQQNQAVQVSRLFAKKLEIVSEFRNTPKGILEHEKLDGIRDELVAKRNTLRATVQNVAVPDSGDQYGTQKAAVDNALSEAKNFMPPELIMLIGIPSGAKATVGSTKPVLGIIKGFK